jgi:hypothetical protein
VGKDASLSFSESGALLVAIGQINEKAHSSYF